jgi:hypothetical protein
MPKTIEAGISMKKAIAGSSQRPVRKYPTIGVCGLDCGLCPRYYTVGSSRCPGCTGPGFFDKHPSCAFITCCVKAKGLEVCAECPDFPCPKFKSEAEYRQMKESSSYPPCRKLMPNLKFIREHGIKPFRAQQRKRMTLLEIMIERFNDGRSQSCYCRAAALLDVTILKGALAEADRELQADKVIQSDLKTKAKVLRAILRARAL